MSSLFPETDGKLRAMGSHHSSSAMTHVWLTPPFILDALGEFDLDPCAAPEPRPWATAKTHWGHEDNSLQRPWEGRVWLNPPYGPKVSIAPWLRRMAEHGCGTALIFARTETAIFFETVWEKASALFFFQGRLSFYRKDGTLPRSDTGGGNAGAPSVLVAYGTNDAARLERSGLRGQFVPLKVSDGRQVAGGMQMSATEGANTRRPAHPKDTISGGPIGPSDHRSPFFLTEGK